MPVMDSEPTRGLLEREECALVVIDLQNRLLPHIHDHERVVRNTTKLVHFAKIAGLPILWTEQENLGETPDEILEHLSGVEPIRKIEFGSFGCEAFQRAAAALGKGTLLLAGIEAHICVAQTALGALPRYRVQVIADAVSSRDPIHRDVAFSRLQQAGVELTCTEMLFYEILRRAGTDEFRAVLPLVK